MPASTQETFASLYQQQEETIIQGAVVTGIIISIENDVAIVDVGLKSEGRVPLKEFQVLGKPHGLEVGSEVDVYVERYEDRNGEINLSRERAKREEAWLELEKKSTEKEQVEGIIFGRVKGGFTVDLGGAIAFLPGSQVDIRPISDFNALMNNPQPFQILKMDKARGNIVVSRRAVLEESRDEARSELVANIREGQTLEGIVKNITDYGAFIDLGGIDGLLHVTDISWRRVNHPSEVLSVGQKLDVMVIKYNTENQRISLGVKQLQEDPWNKVETSFPIGMDTTGVITNITDYGAFVELEGGVEGLIHVSEMSWTKKNVHPGKIVSTSQEVKVRVLDMDHDKRRISLGLKQLQENPWIALEKTHKIGDIIKVPVKNITDFGLFVGINEEIDGIIHISDLDWDTPGEEAIKTFNKGQEVKAKIIELDIEKERMALGIKQLAEDPFEKSLEGIKNGAVITVTVSKVEEAGLEVNVSEGVTGFIKKVDIARDRADQQPTRFKVGEEVTAKITNIDRRSRRLTLSIRARETEEEKRAIEEFGQQNDEKASLGDILGEVLQKDSK